MDNIVWSCQQIWSAAAEGIFKPNNFIAYTYINK